ncbi:MAG: hypothetical protein TR69_WS6001001298 [candidate division WS6 bacterium OLB20]|uniref:OmpH family outer membrane protein n=1 Tax=candidate division WS6 bacterium OLB20 TaxID=1617426 RepID=A0A136LWJ4_9BACT|nr:MAG: hypothetical protein TR69_WS6001001298 [candidate division WS6 bacterium OLB20]
MKTVRKLLITLTLMVLLPVTVSAESADPTVRPTREQTRQERQEQRQDNRNERADVRLERAQERQSTRQELLEQRISEREARREGRQNARCERISTRIERLLEIFVTNGNRIESRLAVVEQRVQNTINQLSAQGVNTSQLQTALETYSDHVRTASEEIDLGIADLQSALDQVCEDEGFNQGQVIMSANEHFRVARNAVADAVEVVDTEIIPIIRQLISEEGQQ